MTPRLDIQFPVQRQWQYLFGSEYDASSKEYLLNHARSGIVMALRAALPNGGRVGIVAYNCHTVANAIVCSGCTPVFLDVTTNLLIETEGVAAKQMDAIIITNLFGLRNNLDAIRRASPKAVLIVDNAHGFGLPVEGDFTIYSINQGKFPALGEGGILYVNNERYNGAIRTQYESLPRTGGLKLFVSMLAKAMMYSPLMYGPITMRLKEGRSNNAEQSPVKLCRMSRGVSRMYEAWLPTKDLSIKRQRHNADNIMEVLQDEDNVIRTWYGDNAFMLLADCRDPVAQKHWFLQHGVETETHFRNAIHWARNFGYKMGECPVAEYLTEHLLMVPTYKELNLKQ